MGNFEVVVFLMAILIGLSIIVDKLKVPYPILLVTVGLLIGFFPQLPDLALDPEIVFLVFLPPLLFDAALKTSWPDFKASIRPISALAIMLVFFTTVSVAFASYYLIPGFSWPLAFLLGAIVSPPDAVAASSITKGLGLNKKVITILEGESLVNDASALIAYRYALAAVITGAFSLWKAGIEFFLVSVGGILIGVVIGYVFVWVHKKIIDNSIVETSLTLLAPFVTYLAAEHLHTSGVLAVVTTGLLISWRSPEIFTYQTRLRNRSVWDTLIFLLNGIVFILIGLQLPSVMKGLKEYSFLQLLGYGLIVSMVTIFVRIIWVLVGASYESLFRGGRKSVEEAAEEEEVSWKNVLIVAWTGTRGVVSLATALALPLTINAGMAFPLRDLILFLAFTVILTTLVIQGLSLPLLIRLLKVRPHRNNSQENKELQLLMVTSTIEFIENDFPIALKESVKDEMKKRYELIASQLTKQIDSIKKEETVKDQFLWTPVRQILTAQKEIATFQRELLIKLHKEGRFSSEALRKMEREFDIEDLSLNVRIQRSKEE